MLILLSTITLILMALFFILALQAKKYDCEGAEIVGYTLGGIAAFVFIVLLGFTIGLSAEVATAHTIDQKIEMCQEENTAIEEKINIAIKNYLEHENGTLTSLNPDEAMAILAVYPELKADTLVAAQVEKYIQNSNEIKNLKTQKINMSKTKWWLYFGS